LHIGLAGQRLNHSAILSRWIVASSLKYTKYNNNLLWSEFLGKMKVGFQLNGSSKRKKITEESSTSEEKRETLLHIEGNILQTNEQTTQGESFLVIPLPPPRIPLPTPPQSLNDLAAQELLADLKGSSSLESTLVIKSIQPKYGGNGAVDINGSVTAPASAPLLLANVAPELMKITNDDERFKVDVSLRAEDLDVHSEIYQSIPIEQFGAAMLRGMGWTGPSPEDEKDEEKYKVVPRESRLGLGATPKPPEEKKKSRHGDQESVKRKEKEKIESWKKKAEEHLEKQKLYVSQPATLLPLPLDRSSDFFQPSLTPG
jgi:hypothetical protein